jgi:hypothetical protein
MSASKLSLLPIDVALRVFFQMRNKKHVDEGTTSEIWILQGDIDSAKALLADGFRVTLFVSPDDDPVFAQNMLTCAAFLAIPRISQFIFNNDKETATVHFTRMLMIAACEAIGTFWDCVGGVEGDHPPPSWMFVYSTEGNHVSHGRNHPVGCGNTNAIARPAKQSREAQAHTVFGVMVRTLTGHTHEVENGLFLVPQFKFLPDLPDLPDLQLRITDCIGDALAEAESVDAEPQPAAGDLLPVSVAAPLVAANDALVLVGDSPPPTTFYGAYGDRTLIPHTSGYWGHRLTCADKTWFRPPYKGWPKDLVFVVHQDDPVNAINDYRGFSTDG